MKIAKLLLSAVFAFAASPVSADDWPNRPVKAITTTLSLIHI